MKRRLFELQETDIRILALKRERSKLDDGQRTRAERQALAQAAEAQTAELNRLNTQRSAQEDQLQAAEAKIAKQQNRLMTAKNAHEVDSLQRDITALTAARGDLDEAILTLMLEAEDCAARLKELTAQKNQKGAELSRIEEIFAAETARLGGELSQAAAKREERAVKLEASEMAKYTDYAKRFHGVAVAHNENGNCSSCGTTLTPFNLKAAKTDDWPTCESCARLLWVER